MNLVSVNTVHCVVLTQDSDACPLPIEFAMEAKLHINVVRCPLSNNLSITYY